MSDVIRVNLRIKQEDHPRLYDHLAQLSPTSRAEFLRRVALAGMMSEAGIFGISGISGISAMSNAPVARAQAPAKVKKARKKRAPEPSKAPNKIATEDQGNHNSTPIQPEKELKKESEKEPERVQESELKDSSQQELAVKEEVFVNEDANEGAANDVSNLRSGFLV